MSDEQLQPHYLGINGEDIPTALRRLTSDGAPSDGVVGVNAVISGVGLQKISALVRTDRNAVPSIPQIGAIKDFQPEPGNFLQHKFLEKALDSRHVALAWPKWSQAKALLHGVFDRRQNQVTVDESHSISQFFGTSRPGGKGIVLQSEEALFLLESGSLQITAACHKQGCNTDHSHQRSRRSIPWSLEDAYSTFMNHPSNPLSLDQYKVFGRLARAGYAVVLHRKTDFTVYERMIGLDRLVKTNPREETKEGEEVWEEGKEVERELVDEEEIRVEGGEEEEEDDDDEEGAGKHNGTTIDQPGVK